MMNGSEQWEWQQDEWMNMLIVYEIKTDLTNSSNGSKSWKCSNLQSKLFGKVQITYIRIK